MPVLADEISLTKVNPETRQKGTSRRNVSSMLTRKEGVSPDSRKSRDNTISRISEMNGLNENARLILPISLSPDLPAIADPIADAISHDPRITPVISSYPPEIFIISLIRSNCTEVLVNPTTNRLVPIVPGLIFGKDDLPGRFCLTEKIFPK